MKKTFHYIENLWLGEDGRPSVRRFLAILFSIDIMRNIDRSITILHTTMKDKVSADVTAAASGLLANAGIIIGIEAGLITGLLALTTFGPKVPELKQC